MTVLSGGIKNLFGCVPGLQKPEMHYRYQDQAAFARMLVELAYTVAPNVTVMDATEAMEGQRADRRLRAENRRSDGLKRRFYLGFCRSRMDWSFACRGAHAAYFPGNGIYPGFYHGMENCL